MSTHNVKRRKLNDVAGQSEATNDAPMSNGVKDNVKHGQAAQDAPAELALASGLYKSSLFKLQVDELLSQLRPDYQKQLTRVEQPLRKLKKIIEDIPSIPPKSVREAEKYLKSKFAVVIPFPGPRPSSDSKYTFEYSKPSSINVVGSFALKTQARVSKAISTIDLAITIPKQLFQEKDYVNYRYFHKRAYYIACVAAGISKSDDSYFKVSFGYQDENTLRPVVYVEPGPGADEKFARSKTRIRILTELENDTFNITRTLPTSNTIRQEHDNVDDRGALATSIYNGALRAEGTVSSFLKLLHSSANKCSAFRDACLLGQTWLKQRGFGSALSCGGFGNFEWTALVALLMEGGGPNGKPILSSSYSSYQIFKATVQFLASRDLTKPLQISSSEISLPSSSIPVLYDGKRGLNILHKMSPWSYISLRHEARLTQKMLNDVRTDHFTDIFITRVDDHFCKYDQLLTVKAPLGLSSSLSAINYQRQIFELLSKALGDRATLLHLKVGTKDLWSTNSKAPGALAADSEISIALLLDQHNVGRLVDHGPSPEDKEEANAFRQFWGDKSELRRFKDGSIMESLLWSDEDPSCSIIQQITSHILNRHLKPKPRMMTFVSDSLGAELRKYIDFSEPLDTFKPVLDAFVDLERVIRDLDELPLKLRHLAPCSPFLRYTSMNTNVKSDATPVDITIEFEGSTRWPDDIAAIQMTKLAFLLKMSDLLESSSEILSCRVGTENHGSTFLNSAFLDIVHCSQITFRLRIYHERGQMLLETQLKNKELSSQVREELSRALVLHKRFFLHTARHTLAFRTLCTKYPLLSPTIRIFKRWASSHLLSPYFHEELFELLVAHVFLNAAPWGLPANAISGFFRTLHLISQWDWQYEPLIVDLNAELDEEALGEIKTKFEAWRNVDPAMNSVALFVVSNIDRDGVIWTQSAKPPKVVSGRLRMLAKAALNLARDTQLHLNIDDLLTSPLSDYDFILRLSSGKISSKATQPVLYKNLSAHANIGENATAVDVMKMLEAELQSLYGQTILFFHDGYGGKVVGGLWNPSTLKDHPWSLKIGYSTVPKSSDDENLLSLNKNAILNEIALMGGDLIQKIEVNRV